MKNKKNIILCIVLIIVIALSLILFLGINETQKTGVQISSFIFIIINELIIFGNALLILNKKLNTFEVAGLSSTTFIYTICSILVNVLLIELFTTVKKILIINTSILLIYLFIITILMLLKKEI